ncbi:MAG: hypothetical protein ACFFAO_06390 [Candidatus Hermodarchaeota archaeon]
MFECPECGNKFKYIEKLTVGDIIIATCAKCFKDVQFLKKQFEALEEDGEIQRKV